MKSKVQNQKTTKLPKIADIEFFRLITKIRNHKVGDHHIGLFDMSLMTQRKAVWNKVLKQMKSQGITFEAFQNQCVVELSRKKNSVIDLHLHRIKIGLRQKIKADLIERIQRCTSWRNYRDTIDEDSKFRKEIRSLIHKEMDKAYEKKLKRQKTKGGNKS